MKGSQKIVFIPYLLAVAFLPINKDILGPFRFTDLFLILAFLLQNKNKQNWRISFNLISIIFVLSLSTLISLLIRENFRIETIVFIYKVLVPFLLFRAFNFLPFHQLKFLYKTLFIISILLTVWGVAYPFLIYLNLISSGSWRASFPFSEYQVSGGHVFSSFLAFAFVAYFLHWKKIFNPNRLFKVAYPALLILSMITTGSRNGFVIIAIFLISLALKKWKTKTLFFSSLFFFPIFGGHILFNNYPFLKTLFQRATNFSFADESSTNRLLLLKEALTEGINYYYILGGGLFNTNSVWYDGLISHFIAYFGISAFILLGYMMFRLYVIQKQRKNLEPFLIAFLYIISNLITEFYLVTRSVLPFMLILCYSIRTSYDEYLNYNAPVSSA